MHYNAQQHAIFGLKNPFFSVEGACGPLLPQLQTTSDASVIVLRGTLGVLSYIQVAASANTEPVMFEAAVATDARIKRVGSDSQPLALSVHRGRFDVSRGRRLRHAVNAKSGAFSDSCDQHTDVTAVT